MSMGNLTNWYGVLFYLSIYLDATDSDILQPILELLRDATFLESFRLVLVTGPMRESTVATISQECQRLSIPLIYMHSVGFYSAISLQLPSVFPIVETHPDPDSTRDLRLTNPWPELAGAATKIDNLDTLDDHQHGHVPYVLLLLLCLDKWKRSHDGSLPKSYQEKREFRDLVRSGARTNNSEGGEENFDEASAAVLKSINPWSMSSSLREIFEMEQCVKLSSSDNFWIIVSAVRTFYTTHGVLPLPGSLPDMKAQSADYVWLQNIYKSKARLDIAEVEATVRKLEGELQLPPGQVSPKEIEIFCKNAGHIKVIQGRGLPFIRPAGGDTDAQTLKTIRNNLTDPESPMPIFVALKVLDKLVSAYQTTDPKPLSSLLDDSDSWERALSEILPGALLDDENVQERITAAMEEARRAGGGELHNMSSFAGGVVAQEALKVLTRQYVPLDNTFIFDGVGGKGAMFRL